MFKNSWRILKRDKHRQPVLNEVQTTKLEPTLTCLNYRYAGTKHG